MPRCEDFPCCGHAANDCPVYEASSGFLPYPCIQCHKPIPKNQAVRGHESYCRSCIDDPRTFCDEGCPGCAACAPD